MYKKTNWKKGDKITPANLNKIEKALEDAHKQIEELQKLITEPETETEEVKEDK